MKAFARLYTALDESNKITDKVAAMVAFFREAPPEEAAWAVHFLSGRRPKRQINSTKMQQWAAEEAGVEMWLFGECYDAVGDLAETIALLLPERGDDPGQDQSDRPLSWWVENVLVTLGEREESDQRATLLEAWRVLDRQERFVFNKLITGAFRVGVSQELVVRALSEVCGHPPATIAHRLMGHWQPTANFYQSLLCEADDQTILSRPYPFCLAHPLEAGPEPLGEPANWQAEWKWDGIRAQVVRRGGETFVWSRGEELITQRFPEVAAVGDLLPDGTVLDGEILAWDGSKPMKFMELQKRIGRKTLTKKILQDVPVIFMAFDLLEDAGEDVRPCALSERRERLERRVAEVLESPKGVLGPPAIRPADVLAASSWEELAQRRESSRDLNVEGLMLKRKDSPYQVGRKKGNWWKWKIEPFTVDAVLIYAQRGSGKRASLYTDYTFGVWDEEGKLVPFAKAYSGLTDDEIRQVDGWVRRHTREKFGPVRTVDPELVMELAFEGIQLSTRHKSGVAVRFPRILRWRHDKKPADADQLASIKAMLESL